MTRLKKTIIALATYGVIGIAMTKFVPRTIPQLVLIDLLWLLLALLFIWGSQPRSSDGRFSGK